MKNNDCSQCFAFNRFHNYFSRNLYKSGPNSQLKSETKITIAGSPYDFNFQIDKTPSEVSFKVDGNLGLDIKTSGKITWKTNGKNTQISFKIVNHGKELVAGNLGYDMSPFSRFKILFKGADFGQQEINLHWTPNQIPYLKIETKGIIIFSSNLCTLFFLFSLLLDNLYEAIFQ